MASNSFLGLLLQIQADPSQAQAAIDQFGETFSTKASAWGGVFGPVDESVQQVNKSLLTSRESTRLLSEEFDIHLPRAVSNAISKIMPGIAGMGTALLGVFAVEALDRFAGKVQDITDKFFGLKAAEEAVKQAGDENLSQMEKLAKASTGYARSQLTLLIAQTQAEETQLENMMLRDLQIVQSAGIAGFAYLAVKDALGEIDTAEKQLANTQKLRDSLVNILGQDEVTEKNDAIEAVKNAQEQELKLADLQARVNRLTGEAWDKKTTQQYDFWAKRREEDNKYWAEMIKEFDLWSALDDKTIVRLREEDTWRIKQQGQLQKEGILTREQTKETDLLTQAMRGNWEAARELSAEIPLREVSNRLLRQTREESEKLQKVWVLEHTQLKLLSADMHGKFIPAFQAAAASVQNLRVLGVTALNDFEQAMGSSIAQSIVMGDSIGEAMQKALKATLASIAAEAIIQALKATALGFLLLAEWDVVGAGHAFTSAGIWAAIGGTTAALGAAIPGGGSRTGAAGYAGAGLAAGPSSAGTMPVSGPAMAPGATSAQRGPIVVNLHIDGKRFASAIIPSISHEVWHNDANLIARQSRIQTPFGGR